MNPKSEGKQGKVALVLGMVNVDVTTWHNAMANKSTRATSFIIRDTLRLRALERAGFTIYTWAQCDPPGSVRHEDNSWSRRGVASMLRRGWPCFTHVFLDYWRMPSLYLRQNATPLLTEVFPLMFEKGLINAHTEIYIPRKRSISSSSLWPDELVGTKNEKGKMILSSTPIRASQNPLSVASSRISHTISVLQRNSEEANRSRLHFSHPFLRLTYTVGKN